MSNFFIDTSLKEPPKARDPEEINSSIQSNPGQVPLFFPGLNIDHGKSFMKILVCIKQVPQSEAFVAKNSRGDWLWINTSATYRMNRFDEHAVEEAVRISEKHPGTTVDVITAGPERSREVLKRAMGMGAANGFYIPDSDTAYASAFNTAAKLAAAVGTGNYDLILTGIMSEDMMQAQTGPMLARTAGIPFSTGVVSLSVSPCKKSVTVTREIDAGITEKLEIRLPALLTIQAGINTPRYPTLTNMLAARKKEIVDMGTGDKKMAAREVVKAIVVPEKTRVGRILEGTRQEKARQFTAIIGGRVALKTRGKR